MGGGIGIASELDDFNVAGPLHLSTVDWANEDHRRSVAACLVEGVYIMERDRQENREGSQALAPRWWEFFNFKIHRLLKDYTDGSIFGAIYKLTSNSNQNSSTSPPPSCVIAFRGTLFKRETYKRDLKLDLRIIRNALHKSVRFLIAINAVRDMVGSVGSSNLWIAGHSLGSAIAMLVGKTMAKTDNVCLQSFLFNSPFSAAPLESIKYRKLKHGLQTTRTVITAGLAHVMKKKNKHHHDTFLSISTWVPLLYVNRHDLICNEYIGYFEQKHRMELMGMGGIERFATQYSLIGLITNVGGKIDSKPIHPIPSANLTINSSPSRHFIEAHGIRQWWRSDLVLESKRYICSENIQKLALV